VRSGREKRIDLLMDYYNLTNKKMITNIKLKIFALSKKIIYFFYILFVCVKLKYTII